MDEQRMTLGILKGKIDEYTGEFLRDLQSNLRELNKFRVKFVHQLFSPGSISELITEAKRALDVANKVINNIELVNNFLDKNDPHKK